MFMSHEESKATNVMLTSVMFGHHHSVATLLREKIPDEVCMSLSTLVCEKLSCALDYSFTSHLKKTKQRKLIRNLNC